MNTKSAFIAIVGKANVGKSSLLNALLGEKIAIVSSKPQTTRTRITGVLTQDEYQWVFLDTPGIHKAKTKLSAHMNKVVTTSVSDVDLALFVVEPMGSLNEEELALRIAALLRRSQIASERKIVVGDVTLSYDTQSVTRGEESVELPKKEFLLLFKLLSSPGKIFTKRQLMQEIWEDNSGADEHTIEVHVGRLRERLKRFDEFEIVTMRGLGYKAVKKV